MSYDISVFHSSEMDDPRLLPGTGWYIGAFCETECREAIGPYTTPEAAYYAMSHGEYFDMFTVMV